MIVEARRNRPASVESNGFVSPVLGNFGLFAALISVGAEVELFRFTLKVEPFLVNFSFFINILNRLCFIGECPFCISWGCF